MLTTRQTSNKSNMLSYSKHGEGRPVILIHGVGLSSECWLNQIDNLSDNHTVYAVDLPGHGKSPLYEGGELDMAALCDELAKFHKSVISEPAIIVGHSLGALICSAFAARYPKLVAGIIPISAVYNRSEIAMSAVKSRSEQLLSGGNFEFIAEAPIKRWFGDKPSGHIAEMAKLCRDWLRRANIEGYAAAYRVFANQSGTTDETLATINVPTLFITGEDDPNSTPEMSQTMSRKTSIGLVEVIEEARHMPQLTHPSQVNSLIRQFISNCDDGLFEKRFNAKELRSAFGSFMTGVTIVTAANADGKPVGFTANSFSSVSIDPPLLLVCPATSLSSFDVFNQCDHFAVNILSQHQQDLSNIFARPGEDRFKDIAWKNDKYGSPIFGDASAHFSCKAFKRVQAGDHIVLIGEVLDFAYQDIDGLGYSKNGYFTLELERKAQEHFAAKRPMTTGVIIEHKDSILLTQIDGKMSLPQITADGINSSLETLYDLLSGQELNVHFGPIYSIYESKTEDHVYTFYRAKSRTDYKGSFGKFIPLNDIETLEFSTSALGSMIRRYAQESKSNGFSQYIGDEEFGSIRTLS